MDDADQEETLTNSNSMNSVQLSHVYTFDHEHTKSVRSIAVSPNGNNLVVFGSFDSTISIWKRKKTSGGAYSYDCLSMLEGHENEVKCVDFHPEENLIASCSRDKSVWLWDYDEDFEFNTLETLTDHEQDVKTVKWVPYDFGSQEENLRVPQVRKKMFASASYDDTIKIYTMDDEGEFYCFQTLNNHSNIVWALCFSKNGNLMFSSSEDTTVKVWKYNSERETKTEPGRYEMAVSLSGYHERAVYTCDYSDRYGLLASAGGDDTLVIYQVKLVGDDVKVSLSEKIVKLF